MKDEMQNLTDLIGELAEDIEEIKTTAKSKDTSDMDEALKRLEVKLELCICFLAAARRTTSMTFSGARKPSPSTGNL